MKKVLLILSMILLAITGSVCAFAEDNYDEEEVTIQPRGPVYQNVIIVDFCDSYISNAFYGNFSTTYKITNINKPIPMFTWTQEQGEFYRYKYIDSQGYEHIPFSDGYTMTERRYENRACGSYGS